MRYKEHVGSKILVAEDDRKIADTVRLYLERDGHEVSVAHDGPEALRLARAGQPALVVLDLMLPRLDGTDVCRILRRESGVYVIMLTARATEEDRLRGLDLGADDYVTKPFSPRELAARVRAVLRRREPGGRGPSELSYGDIRLDLERYEARVGGTQVALTPAEFRLLEAFVRSPGRVFTRREIMERVLGHEYEGFERTVDAHVKNLRKKLAADPARPSPIVTVFGVGYKLSGGKDVP